MTQIMLFLAEYAEELAVFMCSLVIVLLLVTLHRMKRITKLIQEIAGNTNDVRQTREKCEEKEEMHSLPAENGGKQETSGVSPTREDNAELLSEVLEEVFP